jgi:hypothetical protein
MQISLFIINLSSVLSVDKDFFENGNFVIDEKTFLYNFKKYMEILEKEIKNLKSVN